jgi:hypothetical protein
LKNKLSFYQWVNTRMAMTPVRAFGAVGQFFSYARARAWVALALAGAARMLGAGGATPEDPR